MRATWGQAWLTLLAPLFLFFAFRWSITEPFVIPSGSMIPTLLVHDHILVNKLAYGLHIPFSQKWLFQWGRPQLGEIVVFRYPQNPDVFFVKRLIGVPGDRIQLEHGILRVNGQELKITKVDRPLGRAFEDDNFQYFQEQGHWVRYQDAELASSDEVVIPEGQYFVMGDNRDQSSDSRVWGFVPLENFVGRAWLIWLGCDQTLETAQFLCDPATLRWDRFLIRPQ